MLIQVQEALASLSLLITVLIKNVRWFLLKSSEKFIRIFKVVLLFSCQRSFLWSASYKKLYYYITLFLACQELFLIYFVNPFFIRTAATFISYHFHFILSRVFFDLFYSIVVIVLRPTTQINKCSFHHLSKWYLLLCYKQCNFYKISHFYIHVNIFCQKIKSSYLEDLISAEGGIWTLAPRKRSIPLAGAPLQPLEYFSKNISRILIF